MHFIHGNFFETLKYYLLKINHKREIVKVGDKASEMTRHENWLGEMFKCYEMSSTPT